MSVSNNAAQRLRVRVVDEAGKPLARIRVELISGSDSRASGASARMEGVASVLRSLCTNADGFAIFSLQHLPGLTSAAVRFGGRAELSFALDDRSLAAGSRYASFTLKDAAGLAPESDAQLGWTDDGIDAGDVWAVQGIFPDLGELHFGDTYCGRLVPSDLTVRVFDRQQIVRTARNVVTAVDTNVNDIELAEQGVDYEDAPHRVDLAQRPFKLHEGKLLDCQIKWTRLGYTFGDLLYSLPLAPCESVTVAVSHWAQRQKARAEQSSDSQQAQSATYADQGQVSDALSALSSASQRSWGLGASSGTAVGSSGSGIVYGWLLKGTGAAGVSVAGTMTNFSNTAQFASNATHSFSDSIQQSAEGWRRDHQIVVMEQEETQDQNVSYRTVCNNNHCHVLNVFYHEVLNNFRVESRFMGSRDVYLVPYEVRAFDARLALCAKPFLLPFLLDKSLEDCYDETKWQPADAAPPKPKTTNKFRVQFDYLAPPIAPSILVLKIRQTGGAWQAFNVPSISAPWGPGAHDYVVDTSDIDPTMLAQAGLSVVMLWPPMLTSGAIAIQSFKISMMDPASGQWVLLGTIPHNMNQGGLEHSLDGEIDVSYAPPAPQGDTAPASDCLGRILQHLNCNKMFYNTLLWLLEDPNERIYRFDRILVGSDDTVLTDLVNPEPVAVMGNCVAFVKSDSVFEPWTGDPIVDERLVTVPTAGIFADAVLGRCTTCEKKDPDRYWNWKDSPCTCCGKDVSLATPAPTPLFPSTGPFVTYPGSLVNPIVPSGALGGGENGLVAAFGGALATAMLSGKDNSADLKALSDMLASMNELLAKVAPDPGSGPAGGDKGKGDKPEGGEAVGVLV